MKNLDQNLSDTENREIYNEIDFNAIFECISRKKTFIFSVATSVLLLSFGYAFTRKPVWQGRFQIVLDQAQSSSLKNLLLDNLNNSGLRIFGGNLTQNTNLNTELEILKSPSVLKPIFDFVKEQKKLKGKNVRNFRFEDWFSTIDVSLIPKTSVLDLSYKDTDKELILPVINKISDAYKDYPDRDKSKGLLRSINYFEDQITYYLDLSEKAFRDYIAFSLENNLTAVPFKSQFKQEKADENLVLLDIDPRLLLQNQIKQLEVSLNEIDNIKVTEYDDKILPLEIYFEEYDKKESINTVIKKKVFELSELRKFFTENDNEVKKIKKSIKNLNLVLYNNIKDNLNNELGNLKSRLKIISKPKDIVIKSKELQREVFRLEQIINNLENTKQILSLQLAEKNSPWELISTPTLNENPVFPKKKQIVLLGFLSGITLGVLGALYIENISGYIYSLKEFKYLIKYKLIKEIDLNDKKDIKDTLSLIGKNIKQNPKIKNLGLVFLTKISNTFIEDFKNNLLDSGKNISLVNNYNFDVLSNCDSIILIVQKGQVTKDQLAECDQKLKIINLPILGWIFLKDY
tara:strand:+ start:1576 stop:3297 length:1722 start_codon:yes stop_codon:yes gene_type:complete